MMVQGISPFLIWAINVAYPVSEDAAYSLRSLLSCFPQTAKVQNIWNFNLSGNQEVQHKLHHFVYMHIDLFRLIP